MDVKSHLQLDVVGSDQATTTPFGRKLITYADFTASGRLLSSMERFLMKEVYPWYANVHTEVNACARQTHSFLTDARQTVAAAVGAPLTEWAVIFTGQGMTGTVPKLAHLLGLKRGNKRAMIGCGWARSRASRAVVYVGPFEHHSNEVFWREMDCELVVIPEDRSGRIDTAVLERHLISHRRRTFKMGCFSAGSNVTGIQTDVHALSRLLHRHGALAVFDYAAAAPYVPISCQGAKPAGNTNVKQTAHDDASLDAIMLSPHKLPGGPGSCGVLVVRRSIVRAKVPEIPGGGTVLYVGPRGHLYHAGIEDREESGTPNVIGAIRAALAFQLKSVVGPATIHAIDEAMAFRAIEAWIKCPGIELVGSDRAAFHASPRLSILSFNIVVQRPDGAGVLLLHPHFVAAVLNDVYGIQARSGCSCAGPYGHALLDGTFQKVLAPGREPWWSRLRGAVLKGQNCYKPGWTRVNLTYMHTPAEVEYIIQAVEEVSRNAWALLSQYAIDVASGVFTHTEHVGSGASAVFSLSSYTGPVCESLHDCQPIPADHPRVQGVASNGLFEQSSNACTSCKAAVLQEQLGQAQLLYDGAAAAFPTPQPELPHDLLKSPLRWFLLPCEAAAALKQGRSLAMAETAESQRR